MKRLILLTILVGVYAWPAYGAFPTTGTAQTNYCFSPPYLTSNVKPNINIIIDGSGSMEFPAYVPLGTEFYPASTAAVPTTKNYYGYFDNTKYYKYNTVGKYFEDNSAACNYTDRKGATNGTTGATACLSGNLLNWAITTRQDTIRKILTGGRVNNTGLSAAVIAASQSLLDSNTGKDTNSNDTNSITDTGLKCKFTTTYNTTTKVRTIKIENESATKACTLGTLVDSTTKVLTPNTEITGVVQGLYSQAFLVLSEFGGSTATYTVGKNRPLADYVTAINNQVNSDSTPTGTAFKQALAFYKQDTSASTGLTAANQLVVGGIGTYQEDPYYDSDGGVTPVSIPVPCRKSFILLISDGMWPSGNFSSSTAQDPVPTIHTLHKTDLRTQAGLQPDVQTVTTYVVYAYGDGAYGRNSLIASAIFGGYDDKYGDHSTTTTTTAANGFPYPFKALPTDSRLPQTGTTTANSTLNALSVCNPNGTWHQECSEWDKDKKGLPYNYFEGDDGEALQASISKAVNDMLTRSASGTAASMLGNSDSSGAIMLQALFYPERQFDDSTKAAWLGDIQAFWYYLDPSLNSTLLTLREDTIQDFKLKKTEDRIARFIFNGTETKVKLYADADGNGIEDPATPAVEENTFEIKALWRAGMSLWSRMPAGTGGRTIYTYNLGTSSTTNNMLAFQPSTAGTSPLVHIKPYLDVASSDTDATNVINYTLGKDPVNADLPAGEQDAALSGYRSRTVKIDGQTHVWKMGDIINSTPRMLSQNPLNTYNVVSPGGYRDKSYEKYISTLSYKNRGAAFVGGNDGMLHAFKIGKNIPGTAGFVSQIVDATDASGKRNPDGTTPFYAPTELGKELWSYIPKNVLPYLKHRGNPDYIHLFYVDTTPTLIDASIAIPDKVCSNDSLLGCSVATDCAPSGATCNTLSTTCTGSDCTKISTSWRTVLIGSMGLGGATRNSTATCTDCIKTPIANVGYSSYFAMDVTDAANPKLLWEFADPGLGLSTVGPAIVRIKDASDTISPSAKNGNFYVVLASGPTGPVDTSYKQMKGFSDQPLNIYVLNLRTGAVVQTFSNSATALITGVPHKTSAAMPSLAFGGTFSNSTIDTDKMDGNRSGNYSDDGIYLGYVRKDVTAGSPSLNKFAKGGVLRILTNNDPVPANWNVSTVIDGIGPVTAAVAKLQDTYNGNLWLYFATGRFYYKNGSTVDEDYSGQNEALYGLKDPCYIQSTNMLNAACTTPVLATALKNQTNSSSALTNEKGWKIDLGVASGSFKAKRVYTNPTATANGVVFFTSFKPSTEVCGYGGETSIWAVNYSNAASVADKNLKGQAMLQLATGELKQIDLSKAFIMSPADPTPPPTGTPVLGRETESSKGPPSRDETQLTSNANHVPSRKIMHIMER
jgi:type IV pilus assembly protein PilY1